MIRNIKILSQLKLFLKNLYINFFECPKVYLPNNLATDSTGSVYKIPMICYQTWEEKCFYKSFAKSLIDMRKKNCDFSFMLYEAAERDSYMKNKWGHRKIYEVYERARFNPMKADIFRYCILYDSGGVYCDISLGPKRQFRELLLGDHDFFVVLDTFSDHIFLPEKRCLFLNMDLRAHYLLNGLIGAKPQTNFINSVIDAIELWFDHYDNPICQNPRLDIISYTGPGRLTEVFLSKKWPNCKVWNVDGPRVALNHKGSTLRHRIVPSYLDATHQKLF